MIIMLLIIIFIKKCVFRARVFRRTLETRRTLEFYWIYIYKLKKLKALYFNVLK